MNIGTSNEHDLDLFENYIIIDREYYESSDEEVESIGLCLL